MAHDKFARIDRRCCWDGQCASDAAMSDERERAFAWHRAGNLAGAETLYRRLLAASPDDFEIAHNLGMLLAQAGRNEAALLVLRDLVARAPTISESWLLCAMVCRRLGRNEEGLRAATAAVQLNGRDSMGLCLLGNLQVSCGDYHRGEATLRRALEIEPGLAEAWCSLGIALHRQNRFQEAIHAYRRALVPGAGNMIIHYNIGLCADAMGDLPTAYTEFSVALQVAPERLDVRTRLANVQAMLCDFAGEERSVATMEKLLATPERLAPDDQAQPFVLLFLPLSIASRRQILRSYVDKVRREAAGLSAPRRPTRVAGSDRPLRIGYLSPDFGEHAVGTLIQDVFAAHDRNLVSVHGYSLTPRPGPVADSIREGCDVFREVHALSTQALAETIMADAIDILVDLGGFTLGTRPAVMALRPAPLQMGYLGFIHSSGAPWMDYIILDGQVAPPGADVDFSEAIIRLPGTMLPAPAELETGSADRPRFGLPEGVPLFASFNNAYKLDHELLAAWVEIARRLPEARFVVYLPPPARSRFLATWQQLGGQPDSILPVSKLPPAEHAQRAASCDLFLDAFRYSAGATGMAALAAGLPILCRQGQQPVARMGVSLNRFLGLESLICADTQTYIERAVEIGRSGAVGLKQELAAAIQSRGLLDPARTARGLEAAYLAAWQRHGQGLPPSSLDVD
jgi:predicted O-linked N-acetylglucosamine transferase (SPINDLY family)